MTAIRERRIIFSGPMVTAIVAGTKSMTRRVVKLTDGRGCGAGMACLTGNHATPLRDGIGLVWRPYGGSPEVPMPADRIGESCPYGSPGDRLWVREAFMPCKSPGVSASIAEATYVCFPDGSQTFRSGAYYQESHRESPLNWPSWTRWRPSIHMPRWASRITLEITEVRVERLQSISEVDKLAEGATPEVPFGTVWRKINVKPGIRWEDNPWVWCLSFRRVEADR